MVWDDYRNSLENENRSWRLVVPVNISCSWCSPGAWGWDTEHDAASRSMVVSLEGGGGGSAALLVLHLDLTYE